MMTDSYFNVFLCTLIILILILTHIPRAIPHMDSYCR